MIPRIGGHAFWEAAGDYRVWLLFLLYGACFGVEITVDNVAALYFKDSFHVTLRLAGFLASLFDGQSERRALLGRRRGPQ